MCCFSIIATLLTGCGEPSGVTVKWSPFTDSLLHDTVPIHYYADSLRREVLASTNDEEALWRLSRMSEYLAATPMAKVADEAYELNRKMNFKRGIIDATCKKGIALFKRQLYDSAFGYFTESRRLAHEAGNDSLEAQALCWMGDYYRLTYDFESCLATCDTAIEVALKAPDYSRACHAQAFIGDIYRIQDISDTARMYYAQAIANAQKGHDPLRKSFILTNLGEMKRVETQFDSAQIYFDSAYAIAFPMRDYVRMGFILSNKGDVARMTGDLPQAIAYYNQAIDAASKANDRRRIAIAYSSMSDVQLSMGETDKALETSKRCLALAIEIKDRGTQHGILSTMGEIYRAKHDLVTADSCFREAILICEALNNRMRLSVNHMSRAEMMLEKNLPDSALAIAERVLVIAEEIEDGNEIADAHRIIGKAWYMKGNTAKAIEHGNLSIALAREYDLLWLVSSSGQFLHEVYDEQGDYKNAYRMHVLWRRVQDSISGNDQVRKLAAVEYEAKEARLEAEQAKTEAALEADKSRQAQQITRQRAIIWSAVGGGVLLCILLVVAYRAFRNKRRANIEISEQKNEVEKQKGIVEEKNKEVMDSISYARRLQEAILAPLPVIAKSFPESFVVYIPKDIVAGDFYWFAETPTHRFIAAADCTGHGVPGAMVSVICSNALNRAVKEFQLTDPGKILDKVRGLVLETFASSESEVQDGMDISLLAVEGNTYTWSGANRALWIARNGAMEIIRGDKQPVGLSDDPAPFTTQVLSVQKNDVLFLFTDGYADQFGGEHGKKFKTSSLQSLLLQHADAPMKTQQEIIVREFLQWKSGFEQVDDVCVIAVRIK
jgi:serine phosphatase RsbU (regulator of sigma subunit)/tetratricopeptide (TPR) repeat protein